MSERIQVARHEDLTAGELEALQELFDAEYLREFGPWNPDQPYGYSPADVHVVTFRGQFPVAHVGFQYRTIAVGADEVTVAGTGGVLVSAASRGSGLGRRAMLHAQKVMREETQTDFGFLGCREEVVPFYEAAGWVRVRATERSLSRRDQRSVIVSHSGPILICSAGRDASEWPAGDIDLRGTPW
ncbi:GNAT family N-acetyltransferase [Paenarthrobacter ilicis]|uniref:GNAT superfamily N-acetyltransferase n=1 Tax=Paenarthrobacter ilicis TaxID=43665 RepID=A0ABX0TEI7_9MICC|nr:GNAT family N-acetyltransferase [Paenarthrobacter ilicis]MBM7792568.1 GNAT superfamily N-acetyltransferase [Paenarthrobacter ilicis]NIJ00912.1 GNAT superfamily N-acetyltransferase [Paenarthrobacter ilicis]